MTAITLTIFPDAEKWLRENLEQYIATDRVACVVLTGELDLDGLTRYTDTETDLDYDRDLAAHVRALQLLCEQVGRTLFVGGVKSPYDLTDPGNWDVEVADAYFQLVALGEVVYG